MPGHWEGDLVIGKAGKTAVATLVERTSRFLVLVPLHGRDSHTVTRAVVAATAGLPEVMRRSLTWDCGAEMAAHHVVSKGSMPVYFARPRSPWQRGSNENLNRIVREYLPKGVEIPSDPTYLSMIAADINDRPRKIFDWKKPSEVFSELIEASEPFPTCLCWSGGGDHEGLDRCDELSSLGGAGADLAEDLPVLQLGVDPLTRCPPSGVSGVDGLLIR